MTKLSKAKEKCKHHFVRKKGGWYKCKKCGLDIDNWRSSCKKTRKLPKTPVSQEIILDIKIWKWHLLVGKEIL